MRSPGGRVHAKPPWALWPCLAILGAAWLALGWPWLSGQVTIPWDAKAHFYPQLQFLAQSIHRGEWPFWNPYIFAGHPQIADPQSLIFSPPFLALAALTPEPSFRAADATILAMLLLRRDRGFAAGAGSWLASGGGAARRHRVCVWGLSRLAHPAPGTNSQPFLLADRLAAPRAWRSIVPRRPMGSPRELSQASWCWGGIRWLIWRSGCWSASSSAM